MRWYYFIIIGMIVMLSGCETIKEDVGFELDGDNVEFKFKDLECTAKWVLKENERGLLTEEDVSITDIIKFNKGVLKDLECNQEIVCTEDVCETDKYYIELDPEVGEKEKGIITRSIQTDTTCLNGQCVATSYLGAVNIEYDGEFIPIEDYLNVFEYNGGIKFETLDNKYCYFELEYEKTNFLSVSNNQINIIPRRGGYYFTTDSGVAVDSMAYKINCEGFKTEFKDNKFLMDNLYVNFNQAETEQNISTTYEDDKLIFNIVDGKTGSLRMIDPDTGATSPGTMADDATVGTITWATPDEAKTSNDDWATATFGVTAISHYLKATNFGFSIPGGATIDGIVVSFERYNSNAGIAPNTITDNTIKIIKSDGNLGSENKAIGVWATSEGTVSAGGAEDLWSESWDDTDINDADFGVVINVDGVRAFGGGPSAHVDHITITVYYEPAGPTDTCTYSDSGDWNVECSDNCTISSLVTGDGGVLNIGGDAGVFNIDADITGFSNYHTSGTDCVVSCQGGCFKK